MVTSRLQPWYRWRWLTWLLAGVVLGALIYRQMEKELLLGLTNLGVLSELSSFGWPFQHLEMWESRGGFSPPLPPVFHYKWFGWQLAGNCLFGAVLVAATAFFCETWLRRPRRLRFGIQHLLAWTAVLGALMALTREWNLAYRDYGDSLVLSWSLVGWSDLSTPTRWPILFALGCTMYAAGRLAHFHCRRVAMCLQRPKRQAAQDRQDAEPT